MNIYLDSSAGPISATVSRSQGGSLVVESKDYGFRYTVGMTLTLARLNRADRRRAERFGEIPYNFSRIEVDNA